MPARHGLRRSKRWKGEPTYRRFSVLAFGEGKHDQVRPPLDAMLSEQVGDVELHGPFGHVEPVGDLLVREVLHQELVNLALPPAHVGAGADELGPAQGRKGRVHETGEQRPRNPETARRDLPHGRNEVPRQLDVAHQALGAQAQERERHPRRRSARPRSAGAPRDGGTGSARRSPWWPGFGRWPRRRGRRPAGPGAARAPRGGSAPSGAAGPGIRFPGAGGTAPPGPMDGMNRVLPADPAVL